MNGRQRGRNDTAGPIGQSSVKATFSPGRIDYDLKAGVPANGTPAPARSEDNPYLNNSENDLVGRLGRAAAIPKPVGPGSHYKGSQRIRKST
jgi:hypothetical protein